MYLIKSTSFDLEILNPALARASTLNDASTVLNDLVLKIVEGTETTYLCQMNKSPKPCKKKTPQNNNLKTLEAHIQEHAMGLVHTKLKHHQPAGE